jgi:hypothetical protein
MAKISESVNEEPVAAPEPTVVPPAYTHQWAPPTTPAYPGGYYNRYPLLGRPIGLGFVTAFIVILAFLLGVLVGGGNHSTGYEYGGYGHRGPGYGYSYPGGPIRNGGPTGIYGNGQSGSKGGTNGSNRGGVLTPGGVGQGGKGSSTTVPVPITNN